MRGIRLLCCGFALLAVSGARAANEFLDLHNYTLDAPPAKGKEFTVRQAVALTEHWDKYGVVRVAVISDHNLGYELWSGVEFIDVSSRKTYNVDAVRCFVSLCLYVGKIPPGKYFVNRLYSFEVSPTRSYAPQSKTSAPIRNALGSFDVQVHSVTDLGLIGVYRGVESTDGKTFRPGFLGYFPELALLFDETYRNFRAQYFGLSGPELHWDAGDFQQDAERRAPAVRNFFADFSRPVAGESVLQFPSIAGGVYSLDWKSGYSRREAGSLFMISALLTDGDRWIGGGEGGRIYRSEDRGEHWKAVDAFARDETVVYLFAAQGKVHALTVSQLQDVARLYQATDGGFTELARTGFNLEGKSRKPRLFLAINNFRESLTDLYLNRRDLKKIRATFVGESLIVQFNSREFASYGFRDRQWRRFRSAERIKAFVAGPDSVSLLAHQPVPASRTFGDAAGKKEAPLTRISDFTPDFSQRRSTQDFLAAPRGGFNVRTDGSKVAVLSLVENVDQLDELPPAQLYSLAGGAGPAPLRSLEGLAFYYDSDLLWWHDDLVLVDRVAPRVHRIAAEGVTSYRLYEVAYAELGE